MSLARVRKPHRRTGDHYPSNHIVEKTTANKLDLPLVQNESGNNAIRSISNSVLDFLCHPPPLSFCSKKLPFVIAYASPLDA